MYQISPALFEMKTLPPAVFRVLVKTFGNIKNFCGDSQLCAALASLLSVVRLVNKWLNGFGLTASAPIFPFGKNCVYPHMLPEIFELPFRGELFARRKLYIMLPSLNQIPKKI